MKSIVVRCPEMLFKEAFGPAPESAGAARRMVRTALWSWRLTDMSADIEQVTGELVANALPGGTYVVTISREVTNSVHLAVQDNRPGIPALAPADDDDEHGRGLIIVNALADEWGHTENIVWARFTCRPPA